MGALCPEGNLLAASRYLVRRDIMPTGRALAPLGRALCEAVAASGAKLVVPGCEQSVMIIQALANRKSGRIGGVPIPPAIAASLGDPAFYAASLLKSQTLAVARSVGVPVPESVTVHSAAMAVMAAEQIGYPVYLKESFSWAGRGVTRCNDAAALRAAFAATRRSFGFARGVVRRVLDHDWWPVQTDIDLQSGIAGQAAMICALAWHGKMVAGVCAEKLAPINSDGPSIAVQVCHDQVMVDSAEKMIAAMGLHGLVSFDYMLPDDGRPALLIECNPRPVAILNLGVQVGVDFAGLLADLVHGGDAPAEPVLATGSAQTLLFPNALDPAWHCEALARGWHLDMPINEPDIVAAMRDRPEHERPAAPMADSIAA